MLSRTLAEGLESYRIGPKIRALRGRKGLSLVQLGQHTGLSPGLLSKIERCQLHPTLPTLLRIALVFGVGLDHFFVDSEERPMIAVVRQADRLKLPDRPGDALPSYVFESLDFPVPDRPFEAYYAEFKDPAEPAAPHRHAGTELVYLLSGQLVVEVQDQETTLGAGDAITFDSGHPHRYRRLGRGTCAAIVVVAS